MSKIILVAVTSINNKITDGENGDSFSWSSSEDKQYFQKLVSNSNLVIMGRKTFEMNSSKMDLKNGPLRLVLTKNPKKYSHLNIPNHLEFISLTPTEISSQYFSKYNQILILGGSQIYSLFLKENLVNEIFLTIEPYIFSSGQDLFDNLDIFQKCQLIDMERLNNKGSILLKYKLINNENK